MNAFLGWIGRVLANGATGDPSTKRVVFAWAMLVVAPVLLLLALLRNMDATQWFLAFSAYLSAATVGYGVGKAIERKGHPGEPAPGGRTSAAGLTMPEPQL